MELYLDCNATTPVAPEVVAAMEPYWSGNFGNPSSSHRAGRIAKDAIERARTQVAGLVNVGAKQVLFTGSGTEANHLAIAGIVATFDTPGTIAVGATEHPSLYGAVTAAQSQGWRLIELPVDHNGKLTAAALELIATERPALISVMAANNESGVIQPLQPLQEQARKVGAKLHVDATQAGGKIPLDFTGLGVDCLTLSAHKMYGPKGVGALVVAPALQIRPILSGGGQERGLRSGTENVPAIVGFGAAAALSASGMEIRVQQQLACRTHLERGLQQISGVEIVAQEAPRLPNTVMCLISIMEGETLLMHLDQQGIALSSGSACKAGKTAPNRALTAMGISAERAKNGVRISLCRDITIGKVDRFLQVLKKVLVPSGAVWEAVG